MKDVTFIEQVRNEMTCRYRTEKVGRFRKKAQKAIIKAFLNGETQADIKMPYIFPFTEFEKKVMLNHFPDSFGCDVFLDMGYMCFRWKESTDADT